MKDMSFEDKNRVLVCIGKYIRLHRKLKGWTIEELAAQSMVSINFIGQIERGESNPSFEIFFKLSVGLKIDPISLFSEIKTEIFPIIEEEVKQNLLEE